MYITINTSTNIILSSNKFDSYEGEIRLRGFLSSEEYFSWVARGRLNEELFQSRSRGALDLTTPMSTVELVENTSVSNTYNELIDTKYLNSEIGYYTSNSSISANTAARDSRLTSELNSSLKDIIVTEITFVYSKDQEFKFMQEQIDNAASNTAADTDLTEYTTFKNVRKSKYQTLKTSVANVSSANLHLLDAQTIWANNSVDLT